MWFLIGVAAGIAFCFATDGWRVRMLLSRGYDNAVRDILEYCRTFFKSFFEVILINDIDLSSF